ncbi:MAG: retropepsin-like domain-containing protein [Caulobacteraceae bacterium]|nr:retropepsin-like domain-containing protein [Caulobacteraceae bacterium]
MRGESLAAALAVVLLAASGPAQASCQLSKVAELPVIMNGMAPLVNAKVNGVDARFIADTGAAFSLIKPQLVLKFSLSVNQGMGRLEGTTGEARAMTGWAQDFSVLGGTLHRVEFVLSAPELGYDSDGLLGANFLTAYDTEFDLADGDIRFFRPLLGCDGGGVVYWSSAGAWSELKINPVKSPGRALIAEVLVNGVKLRAQFDTGAVMSVIKLEAARRAGLTPDMPGAVAVRGGRGVSGTAVGAWLAPVKSFELGPEKIADTHMRIAPLTLNDIDMLIGADFFMTHRVFVAISQSKVYFTADADPAAWTERSAERALLPVFAPNEPEDPEDAPKGEADFDHVIHGDR